jgi:pimeloyl-ACP methyl ester carboxylesterase
MVRKSAEIGLPGSPGRVSVALTLGLSTAPMFCGTATKIRSLDTSATLNSGVARLVLLNNRGHWPPFEKPAEWTAQVLAFLKGY